MPSKLQARYVSELPPKMGEGLRLCHTTAVSVTRKPGARVHENTIRALVRHELIEAGHNNKAQRVWRLTERGLRLLLADEPRLLRPKQGYTTEPAQAMRDEPEAVDEAWIAKFTEEAGARWAAGRAADDTALMADHRSLEERLVVLRRLALARGLDARSELRLVERALGALERKILNQRRAA